MSAAAVLDYTYHYPFASNVDQQPGGATGLSLATCDAQLKSPHFFEGKLLHPRETGDMLLVLSDVVRTHFFLPVPALLDPVVTSNERLLRFEGFSGCCGVYARVDLKQDGFDADMVGRGTTNVDFNNPMRAALSRLRDGEDSRLSVGAEAFTLEHGGDSVVEKKVKLPVRWLKGFSEVQAYQPQLSLKIEVPGSEARRFIRTLPKAGAPKRPSYVVQTGKALRLSQREARGSVQLLGTHRVRVLEPLMSGCKALRIWSDEGAGNSAWEVITGAGAFFLMVSPEVYRGFSGEGQVLEQLATGKWEHALPAVQAQLGWQSEIDAEHIAEKTGFSMQEVEAALAALGTRGLAGYDASAGAYFHREMPFDLDLVDKMQPRLKGANKLLADGKVKIVKRIGDGSTDLSVGGTGVDHYVRLRDADDEQDKCTCPWFSKYQGERGPCKHILAARMFVDGNNQAS
ncbi:MAG: SWIM zinc finger family protein [Planctomycetota bacterium]